MRILHSRWFLGLCICAILLLLASGIGLSYRIQHEWEEMIGIAAEIEVRLENQPGVTRPVLHANPIEGDGWPEYLRAAALMPADSDKARMAYTNGARSDDVSKKKLAALIKSHAPAVAALIRAARHTQIDPQVDWYQGLPASTAFPLLTSRSLVVVATLSAREHLNANEVGRATDILLALMQFGRDLRRSPFVAFQMVGCGISAIATKEVLVDPDSHGQMLIDLLPTAELERIADGMRLLDEGIEPVQLALESHLAVFTMRIQDRSRADHFVADGFSFRSGQGWSYAFSSRLMCADYIREGAAWSARHRAVENRPWSERLRLFEQEASEMSNSLNPIRKQEWMNSLFVATSNFDSVWLLRVARMVVDERLGKMKPLHDPYGTEIAVSKSGGRYKLMSKGPDGSSTAPRYSFEFDDAKARPAGR